MFMLLYEPLHFFYLRISLHLNLNALATNILNYQAVANVDNSINMEYYNPPVGLTQESRRKVRREGDHIVDFKSLGTLVEQRVTTSQTQGGATASV